MSTPDFSSPAGVAAFLRQYNNWRRDESELDAPDRPKQPDPSDLGRAIDAAVRMLEGIAHAPSPCQGRARQQEADEASQDSPWIDPNDKTQKQFLPWVGEKVFFCHAGMTYYGWHTGGSFQSFNPPKRFDTWSCRWMYPPKAAEKIQQTEAGG